MASATRIKVCCIASAREARAAITAGADAIGLVAEMPSGPGPIPDESIREIASGTPPPIATFLLTSRTEPESVVAHVHRCRTNVVQLVDAVPVATYEALREHCPAVKIVQVVHVQGAEAIEGAARAASYVDALLLDSGKPDAKKKTLGGTGDVHDWDLSAAIVRESATPVFLAGGLRSENVREAIERVRPYGVDLCSGVRTDGALDMAKLTRFVSAVRDA